MQEPSADDSAEEEGTPSALPTASECTDPCRVVDELAISHPAFGDGTLYAINGVPIPEAGHVIFEVDGEILWSVELIGFILSAELLIDSHDHVYLLSSPGTRRTDLIVLAPSLHGFEDFGSLDGRFSHGISQPVARFISPRDTDGDGKFELVVEEYSCDIDYICDEDPLDVEVLWWNGSDYESAED